MQGAKKHLHFFCGKIGSGKTTLAARIAKEQSAILIQEDVWTAALWPNELKSIKAYKNRSTRLKKALWPLASEILQSGTSLVLDFPANTISQRDALRSLIDMAHTPHTLHFLDTSVDVCKARLKQRNKSGDHQYQVTEEQFEHFSSFFVPPAEDEAFNVKVWSA
jgi:predicted kinase